MNKLYSVVYSPKAKDDLKEIYTYIPFYTVDTRSLTVTVIRIFFFFFFIENIAADFENL